MSFVNCGAYDATGRRFPSKKSLREALAACPESVTFDATSIFHTGKSLMTVADLDGQVFSVVGPEPATNRKYYANVRMVNGKLKVQ